MGKKLSNNNITGAIKQPLTVTRNPDAGNCSNATAFVERCEIQRNSRLKCADSGFLLDFTCRNRLFLSETYCAPSEDELCADAARCDRRGGLYQYACEIAVPAHELRAPLPLFSISVRYSIIAAAISPVECQRFASVSNARCTQSTRSVPRNGFSIVQTPAVVARRRIFSLRCPVARIVGIAACRSRSLAINSSPFMAGML